jgi:hypothetical protein
MIPALEPLSARTIGLPQRMAAEQTVGRSGRSGGSLRRRRNLLPMSDVWRDLPLSARARDDESSVTNDWRPRAGQALQALCESLGALPAERWSEPSLTPARRGVTLSVSDTAVELLQALDNRLHGLLPGDSKPPADPLLDELQAAARRLLAGEGRKGLGPLKAVVQHCYDIALPLALPDPVESRASGAVALGLAAAAPTPLRGVLAGRSLIADDADWEIGRGPAIRGTAGELVSWLGGRAIRPRFDAPKR